MLVIDLGCFLFLMILFKQSLSIPLDYDDFYDTGLSPDFSSFLPEEYPGANSNLLSLSSNDADPGTASESNLLNYSPSDAVDWLSPPTQADENSINSIGTFNDMLISDSGAICPLGKKKKRDDSGSGSSCSSSQELSPNTPPLPDLHLPDVLGTFGITNSNDGSTVPSGASGDLGTDANANAVPGSLTSPDPCLTRAPYLMHACCDGPPNQLNGDVYVTIEKCALGT